MTRRPAGNAVLGHHRRDVGVVVLHLGHRARRGLVGPPPRLVARVGVGGHLRGRDAVEAGELPGGALEGRPRLEAAHVADVLAHEGVVARGEAERVLQLAADGERRCGREGQPDGQGCVAPRAPQRELACPVPGSTSSTESSQGTWMGRSWSSQASAMAPSRRCASSSSKQIGSSVRLPLVITSTSGTRATGTRSRRPARRGGGAAGCRAAARRAAGCPVPPAQRRRCSRPRAGAARTIGRSGRGEEVRLGRVDVGQGGGRLEVAAP